jgi:hypothetical protein
MAGKAFFGIMDCMSNSGFNKPALGNSKCLGNFIEAINEHWVNLGAHVPYWNVVTLCYGVINQIIATVSIFKVQYQVLDVIILSKHF